MGQVLILSDSHRLTDELSLIKIRHHLQYNIHCGDSELPADAPELEGFIKVTGNCDRTTSFPEEEVVEIDGLRFFITHGHLYGVKANLTNLMYRAAEVNAHIVCFGHSHIAGAEKLDNQLFINPGSIRRPRNRAEKTYAILTWEGLKHVQVTFYTLDGNIVPDLSYQTSLA